MEKKLIPIIESYNVEEEYLYIKSYLFLKGMAVEGEYINLLKALPLARKLHDGQHRKGLVEVNGKKVHLPYVLHVLKVCDTLAALRLPMTHDELDILYTSAILHDALEDAEQYFPKGGIELVTDFGFPKEVYEVITLLSKHSGADEYELNEYFNRIKKNKIALLIKMSDRSHNVEDLYNMKLEKLHKYVTETRQYIYPLSSYAKQNYPELSSGVTILKSKIVSLTECTETIVDLYEEKLKEKDDEITALKKEMEKLKDEITSLQEELELSRHREDDHTGDK